MTLKSRRSRAVRKPPRKKSQPRRKPNPLDAFIAAGAQALNLKLDRSWLPAVRGHLQVTLRLGALVEDFALPDDAQPAAVFEA